MHHASVPQDPQASAICALDEPSHHMTSPASQLLLSPNVHGVASTGVEGRDPKLNGTERSDGAYPGKRNKWREGIFFPCAKREGTKDFRPLCLLFSNLLQSSRLFAGIAEPQKARQSGAERDIPGIGNLILHRIMGASGCLREVDVMADGRRYPPCA